ncbi:MAG TPA: hypothetical protein PLV68_02050, partial [Ilumatobacteraceae bacterium]|nr:hypothetical protein [Ilumatobacteraceae bacterium]
MGSSVADRAVSVAPPAPRAHLAGVTVYQPGKSAEEAMAEHGIDSAVKLASNELPFGPLPGVTEAVIEAMATTDRYADHISDRLATAFADLVGVRREQVAVGPGSVGLLQQIALAYAGPGTEVVYPW